MRRRCTILLLAAAFEAVTATASADDEPTTPAEPTAPPSETEPTTEPDSTPMIPSPAPASSAPVPPPAPGPAPFGAAGVVVVTADSSLGGGGTVYTKPSEAETVYVDVGPGFDVFVARQLSIGGGLGIGYSKGRGYLLDGSLAEYDATTVSGGLRVGYAIPLGPLLSLYPRLTGGYSWSRSERTTLKSFGGFVLPPGPQPFDVVNEGRGGAYVSLFAPVLLHPTTSFFVGFGPVLYHGPSDRSVDEGPRTTIQGRMIVGGHWGGAPTPVTEAAPADDGQRGRRNAGPYRFGETGDLVISGDFRAAVGHSSYASGGHDTSFSVGPAIDYFVARHFSLGIGGRVGSSAIEEKLANGSTGRYVTTGGGIDTRIGFEISLMDRVSLYPRVSLGFATSSTTQRALGAVRMFDSSTLTTGISFPFVVHAARHFFIGWGPYLSRELVRWADAAASETRGTSFGAALFVGGWL